ncbi:MAG: prepilin peptidase [Desulfocapsaceae bacterium]|nr:prepilin peptidase [Desulfocapsaceae bacterium]
MHHDPLILTLAAIFGAAVGSFLNVVILRLPQENSSIVFPASHCPLCKSPLSWTENIPVISYLFLRGRCGHCRAPISIQYPLVEALTAILTTALVYRFGLTPTTAGYFLFVTALIVIIWIDIHHQIIPDVISLPGIVIGLAFAIINSFITWQDSLIGLLAGGGILYAVALLYYLIRKQEGMGGGDIKLLAMIGAFLGWQSLPFVILISSITGSGIGLLVLSLQKKGANTRIPFGPFLSCAALVYLFFRETILHLFRTYYL